MLRWVFFLSPSPESYRNNLWFTSLSFLTFQACLCPPLTRRLWQTKLLRLLWQRPTLCMPTVAFSEWLTAQSQGWVSTTSSDILKSEFAFECYPHVVSIYGNMFESVSQHCVCVICEIMTNILCARLFPQARTPLTWCWNSALRRQTVSQPLKATHRHAPSEEASLWWDVQYCVLVCLMSEGCSLTYKGRNINCTRVGIVFTSNDITSSDTNANCRTLSSQ